MRDQNEPETNPAVTIVGGGITGLSAAWHLQQVDREIPYIVLESSGHWGGFLRTERIQGPDGGEFIVDAGPESFITRKPEAWALTQALGLEDRALDTGSETRDMYVLHGGIPKAVPLSPVAFLQSDLISLKGKARLLAEPFIRANRDDADESLGDFVRRRLGQEALERFIGPVLAGIYNTDPETQSILTTSPVMREMERAHGSLFIAAVMRMRDRKRLLRSQGNLPPRFFTFKEGVQELVDRLVNELHGGLKLNNPVKNIVPNGNGYWVVLKNGDWIPTRALVLATPANVTAGLLEEAAPEAASALAGIRYSNIGTISLAYRTKDIQTGFRFNGLMVPRRERRAIDAVVWTSAKLPGRAPEGFTLLRVFFGGSAPEMVVMEEEKLLSIVHAELREMLDFQGNPIDHRVFRWPDRFPQADVGHLDRVRQIESLLPEGIALAGSAYRGIGVPDCIRQGKQAAQQVLQSLQLAPKTDARLESIRSFT